MTKNEGDPMSCDFLDDQNVLEWDEIIATFQTIPSPQYMSSKLMLRPESFDTYSILDFLFTS